MNRSDRPERLAKRTGMSRAHAGEAQARGDEVRTVGFGTFVTGNRPACSGGNSRTGEKGEIEPSVVPTIKLGQPIEDAVNAGGSS